MPPISGTASPALSVPKRFEATPTAQGSDPPPRLASVNMTEPTREAAKPNSCDNREIVMGYTLESPNPARLALTPTPSN